MLSCSVKHFEIKRSEQKLSRRWVAKMLLQNSYTHPLENPMHIEVLRSVWERFDQTSYVSLIQRQRIQYFIDSSSQLNNTLNQKQN